MNAGGGGGKVLTPGRLGTRWLAKVRSYLVALGRLGAQLIKADGQGFDLKLLNC